MSIKFLNFVSFVNLTVFSFIIHSSVWFLNATFKSKRRKEQPKMRRGKQVEDPPEEPKPPRTTHKLLQVLSF